MCHRIRAFQPQGRHLPLQFGHSLCFDLCHDLAVLAPLLGQARISLDRTLFCIPQVVLHQCDLVLKLRFDFSNPCLL